MKTLLFEGAGMNNTGGKNVGNCRLRTRIENKSGRLIYFELGGTERSKYSANKMFDVCSHIDHLFYDDIPEDSRTNYSKDFFHLLHNNFEYTRENILNFVNKNLNCDFDFIEISDSVYVHDTKNPLCSSMEIIKGK